MTTPGSGPLCRRVLIVAGAAAAALPPGPTRAAIDDVLERLAEPVLRIAVGGRVKAGKSTLINALIGQDVAATAATECTLLVAWFRAGPQNRVVVHHTDGRRVETGGRPGGGVPRDLGALGVPRERIRELEVELVNRRLATRHSIVDTPGVDALSGLDDVAMAALARADALLYAMPHPGHRELEALEALRRKASGSITAATVIGVLSRVDELGEGVGDPWPQARRLATRYARSLTGLVGTIVPVVGLLAEAAAGDRFTDDDTRRIAGLAKGATEAELATALYAADTFLAWESGPLSAADRHRLLTLLGRYGITESVAAWHRGLTDSAALLDQLRAASGIDALTAEIDARFLAGADRLRAARALAALDRLSSVEHRKVLAALRADLAEVRAHPLMRQAALGAALADLANGTLSLSPADAEALVTLATGTDPAACLGLAPSTDQRARAAEADRRAARWRIIENTTAAAPTRRHARAARELCEALFFQAQDD